ncbi:MAG: accessory gene regulator ArgB-like protein [Saccharofermentanales bacterium]
MEKLANRISMKIASELSYSQDQQEVIEYGLIALIQTVVMMITVLLLGLILGIFIEAAVVCFGVSILRKYSGGAHASSIMSCTIISTILCIGFAFLGRVLAEVATSDISMILITLSAYLFAVFITITKVPVDSPNKPILSAKKRLRLKVRTLIVLTVYLLISAVLIFSRNLLDHAASASVCLTIAIAWQMGTLTGPGSILVEGSDRLVYRIITLKGGHNNNED